MGHGGMAQMLWVSEFGEAVTPCFAQDSFWHGKNGFAKVFTDLILSLIPKPMRKDQLMI